MVFFSICKKEGVFYVSSSRITTKQEVTLADFVKSPHLYIEGYNSQPENLISEIRKVVLELGFDLPKRTNFKNESSITFSVKGGFWSVVYIEKSKEFHFASWPNYEKIKASKKITLPMTDYYFKAQFMDVSKEQFDQLHLFMSSYIVKG